MSKRFAELRRRLLAAARQADGAGPAVGELSPPAGFARRVAALWAAEARRPAAVWSPSWRPVAAAVAVVLLSLGLNWSALHHGFAPRDLVTRSMSRTFYPR